MNESIATQADIKTLHETTLNTLVRTDAPESPWLNAGMRNTVRYAYALEHDRIEEPLQSAMGVKTISEGAANTWELDISFNGNPETADALGFTSLYSLVVYSERPSGLLVRRRCWAEMDRRNPEESTFTWKLLSGTVAPSKAGEAAFYKAYSMGYASEEARAYIDTLQESDPDYAVIIAGHIAQACGVPDPEVPYDGPLKELFTEPEQPVNTTTCQALTRLVDNLTLQDQTARVRS